MINCGYDLGLASRESGIGSPEPLGKGRYVVFACR